MPTIHHGDCIETMNAMPPESVDAIVCDPPYGLSNTDPDSVADTITKWASGDRDHVPTGRGFMGKSWDAFVPPPAVWDECMRVLKPGGHMVVFAGSRTQDLMGLSIRLAGFEMRDSLAWLYGSGFSKAGLLGNRKGVKWCECGGNVLPYDHASETDLPRLRNNVYPSPVPRREGEDPGLLSPMQREAAGRGMEEARAQGPGVVDGGVAGIIPAEDDRRPESSLEGRLVHRTGQGLQDDSQARTPPCEGERVRGGAPTRDGGDDRSPGHAPRGGASHQPRPGGQPTGEPEAVPGSHEPLDDGALRGRSECPRCGGLDQAYRGFSTALKPAHEPVIVARKPLAEKTVARNVLAYGTGAINVDACRIGTDEKIAAHHGTANPRVAMGDGWGEGYQVGQAASTPPNPSGRWPANVLLDQHTAAWVDEQSGVTKGRTGMTQHSSANRIYGEFKPTEQSLVSGGQADEGGASRFFYTAKAPKSERPNVDGVQHPTVKPLAIMRWLIRLVTPPGGVVLDPFAGSGTTIEAALIEGFDPVGIEMETDYLPLIQHRIDRQAATLTA